MLRILLFSPKGSGSHYYGPGMSAYRMYKHLNKDEISVSLVHGYKDQTETDVFEEYIYLSDLEKLNVFTGTKFFLKAKKWAKKNAERFDVLHCLSAFHSSFLLAVWFEKKAYHP